MAQANYMQKYIQQAQQQSDWEKVQELLTARERVQTQQAMINQWAKEGNNGALLGNILSSALMKYFNNMPDTTLPGGNSGNDAELAAAVDWRRANQQQQAPMVIDPHESDYILKNYFGGSFF